MAILVFLPGKLKGQRSPVGYRPEGSKESDMPEYAHKENRFLKAMYKVHNIYIDPEYQIGS